MDKDKIYRVFVNSKPVELKKIRVSAMPFNREWPGKQRDISQSEIAFILKIVDDGTQTVTIEKNSGFNEAVIRPLGKGVKAVKNNNRINFTLEKYGFYSVEFDGVHNAIHLFYEPKRDFAEYGTPTYSFGAGEHNVGLLKLKSGDSVFIDEKAVVHGSIYGVDVENIKIFGYGVLDGGFEERTEKNGDVGWTGEADFSPEKVHTYGGIRFYRAKNIVIDGITVTDPASYAVSFFDVENIKIHQIKVVGLWKYNTDGIDFFNCSTVKLTDSFVRSFDDSICIKGITAFSKRNSENFIIDNCVLWCEWGLTCEIGLATACDEIKNVVFKNCDLIHNTHVCMDISNGQWAFVHNVLYENINVEYSRFAKEPIYQKSDEQEYTDTDFVQMPFLVRLTDARRKWAGNLSEDDPRCKIGDIRYKNINIVLDKEIKDIPKICIKKCMPISNFYNIVFENIIINNKQITDLKKLGVEDCSVAIL